MKSTAQTVSEIFAPPCLEQWSRNPVTRVRNQGDALVPFGKALILITRSLGEAPKAVVRLVAYLQAFMLS